MKAALIIACAALLAGCGVNPTKAERAGKAMGLKDMKLTGWALFGCSEDDTFRSNFTATAADGSQVTGTVCSGLLKGTTIRIN